MAPSEPGAYAHVCSIGVPRVREGVAGHAYVAFARAPEAGFGAMSFSAELRFASRECDPAAGYEPVRGAEATKETYPVNDVEVGAADYVAPLAVADFRATWDAAGADGEVLETFALSFKSVPDAVAAVLETLGLAPQEGTGLVKPTAAKHAALLAGTFLGDTPVFGRMLVALDDGPPAGVTLKVALRCANKDISELLVSALA
jgi:coatomer protein complex subunit gamma